MRVRQTVVIGGIVSGMIVPTGMTAGGGETAAAAAEVAAAEARSARPIRLEATKLPPLGEIGYAGMLAGASEGVLIAAGGSNFPDAPPWKQGKKTWYDRIWVLEPGAAAWRDAGTLPRANALGASLTLEGGRGVLCVGGGDADEVYADVFVLTCDAASKQVRRDEWPSLPHPLMAASAAVAAGRVYVVGGHETVNGMAGTGPLQEVWSIDPGNLSAGWRAEPPIPGAGRYLPMVAGDSSHLYVFSGMTRKLGDDGKPVLHCLEDAWRYAPEKQAWTPMPDLPRANAAAPSPSPVVAGQILFFGGGVDDTNFGGPMENRPGFPATALAVDAATGAAEAIGDVKTSVVAAPLAPWNGGFVVVSGEIRAGVRSPDVWHYRTVVAKSDE